MDLLRHEDYLSKIDISEYYRNFPMAFHHWKDLTFKWKNFGGDFESVLLETCMPFGLSPACGIGATFTSAVVRHIYAVSRPHCSWVPGWFLVIGKTYEDCLRSHEYLIGFWGTWVCPSMRTSVNCLLEIEFCLEVELSTELPFCTAGVDATRVNHILESIDSLMRSSTVSAKKWRRFWVFWHLSPR